MHGLLYVTMSCLLQCRATWRIRTSLVYAQQTFCNEATRELDVIRKIGLAGMCLQSSNVKDIQHAIKKVHIPMDVLGLSWTSSTAVRSVPASSHIAKNTLHFIMF
jgi:hypothetical protein